MDAAGLASSIITFIDVAYKIVRETYDVHKSANGATEENDHTSLIVNDLEKVAASLKDHPQTKNDEDLVRLSTKCYELSRELLQLLERFLPKGPGRWQSFVAACHILRKQRETASIEERLDRYRQQIVGRLLWLLFQEQSPVRGKLDEMIRTAHTFNSSSVQRMEHLEARIAQTLELLQKSDEVQKMESQVKDVFHDRIASTETEANFESIGTVSPNPTATQTTMGLSDLVNQVQSLTSLVHDMPMQTRVLRRLFFQSIFRREDEVVHAAEETFEWIFGASMRGKQIDNSNLQSKTELEYGANEESDAVRRLRTSTSLMDFLRNDGSTFFIAGKAGCGKSTFMKYIAHHEKTETCLKAWASAKKLVLIKVFFWQSEDLRQGSMEGFYRSILFQVLSQCPELTCELFPPQRTHQMPDTAEYRLSELQTAFKRLLEIPSADEYQFCCFIDGLDEHQGDNMNHEDLVIRLISWSSLNNVKVMCSARPYTVFLKAFRMTGDVVLLHQLTSSDVSNFANYTFKHWLSKAGMQDARNNCLALVKEITDMAEGIFLWAAFVVRDLINQALDDDGSESALRRRLKECLDCGDSLDGLFQLMLQKVGKSPSLQMRSNMVLYIAANNPFELPLNALIYSWLDELEWFQKSSKSGSPVQKPQKPYTEGEILSRVERVRNLLHQLTRGLLEVIDTHDPVPYFRYRVGLCHRSVRDFLRGHWKSGTRQPPLSSMEEAQAYCRVRSMEAVRVPCSQSELSNEPNQSILDYGESIKDNLRWLVEYTFIWLGSRKGGALPHHYLEGFERALLQLQELQAPFLPGHLLIKLDDSGRYSPRNAITTTSFLHWAAYWSQGEFVKWRLSDNAGASNIKDETCSCELSLLLSSSIAADVETTRHLLNQNFEPAFRVQIKVAPDQDSLPTTISVRKVMGQHIDSSNQTASVWMVYLRDFAMNVRAYCRKRKYSSTWPLYMDRDWLERLARIIEAYLRAHADPRIYYVLSCDSPRETYRASLYQMLDVFKPENLTSIAALLNWKTPWWRGLLGGLITPTTNPLAFQHITTDLLLSGDWKVIGVCSENGQELMGGFEVRVF